MTLELVNVILLSTLTIHLVELWKRVMYVHKDFIEPRSEKNKWKTFFKHISDMQIILFEHKKKQELMFFFNQLFQILREMHTFLFLTPLISLSKQWPKINLFIATHTIYILHIHICIIFSCKYFLLNHIYYRTYVCRYSENLCYNLSF